MPIPTGWPRPIRSRSGTGVELAVSAGETVRETGARWRKRRRIASGCMSAEGARFELFLINAAGPYARAEVEVTLEEGAHFEFGGVTIGGGDKRREFVTRVLHSHPNATIGPDGARGPMGHARPVISSAGSKSRVMRRRPTRRRTSRRSCSKRALRPTPSPSSKFSPTMSNARMARRSARWTKRPPSTWPRVGFRPKRRASC